MDSVGRQFPLGLFISVHFVNRDTKITFFLNYLLKDTSVVNSFVRQR